MVGLGGGHGGDLGRACRREAEGEGKKRARERGGREKREGIGELIPSSRRSVAFIPTGIDGEHRDRQLLADGGRRRRKMLGWASVWPPGKGGKEVGEWAFGPDRLETFFYEVFSLLYFLSIPYFQICCTVLILLRSSKPVYKL
jgi:hypothetical protein